MPLAIRVQIPELPGDGIGGGAAAFSPSTAICNVVICHSLLAPVLRLPRYTAPLNLPVLCGKGAPVGGEPRSIQALGAGERIKEHDSAETREQAEGGAGAMENGTGPWVLADPAPPTRLLCASTHTHTHTHVRSHSCKLLTWIFTSYLPAFAL